MLKGSCVIVAGTLLLLYFVIYIIVPGPCRHDRAAGFCAELSDGAVQHVDLVEKVHSWNKWVRIQWHNHDLITYFLKHASTHTHYWLRSTRWGLLPPVTSPQRGGFRFLKWLRRVWAARTGESLLGCSSWAWTSWMNDFHCNTSHICVTAIKCCG